MKTVDKPWGSELIWGHTDKYVGKILVIKPGQALSLQYHQVKDETIYIQQGAIDFEYYLEGEEPKHIILSEGQSFHIPPGMRHRMVARDKWVNIIEASTPELDDVVRLEDRYGRI